MACGMVQHITELTPYEMAVRRASFALVQGLAPSRAGLCTSQAEAALRVCHSQFAQHLPAQASVQHLYRDVMQDMRLLPMHRGWHCAAAMPVTPEHRHGPAMASQPPPAGASCTSSRPRGAIPHASARAAMQASALGHQHLLAVWSRCIRQHHLTWESQTWRYRNHSLPWAVCLCHCKRGALHLSISSLQDHHCMLCLSGLLPHGSQVLLGHSGGLGCIVGNTLVQRGPLHRKRAQARWTELCRVSPLDILGCQKCPSRPIQQFS